MCRDSGKNYTVSVNSCKKPGAQQSWVYRRDCEESGWSSLEGWKELLVNKLSSVCVADIFFKPLCSFIKM